MTNYWCLVSDFSKKPEYSNDLSLMNSVTKSGDLFDFGQLFKVFVNN